MSVEKVVATIESPKSHQGIFRPERKNSEAFSPDFFETINPISKVKSKKEMMIIQSRFAISISENNLNKSKEIF